MLPSVRSAPPVLVANLRKLPHGSWLSLFGLSVAERTLLDLALSNFTLPYDAPPYVALRYPTIFHPTLQSLVAHTILLRPALALAYSSDVFASPYELFYLTYATFLKWLA